MVWGGISHGVKMPLVVIQGNLTAVRYRDQVLMPHVLPLINAHNLTFQHDNARPHVARFVATSSTRIMSKCSIGPHTVQI